MANLITLGRLLLLIAVAMIVYQPPGWLHVFNVALLAIVFISDGLDGYVARRRNEESVFGAMFDIAGDRIVEMTMWIVLVHVGMVAVWVPIVFVVRGAIVDTIRSHQVTEAHVSPFDAMRTGLGQWLVASRFMRGFYATLKAVTFCWLLLIRALPGITPQLWIDQALVLTRTGDALVLLTVFTCLLRGAPVVWEFASRTDLVKAG